METTDLVAKATLLGAGGWAIENVLSRAPRYSALFKGARVPFLPVYALGGAAVLALAPHLRETEVPWYVRAAIYGGALSAIEYAGCLIDREMLGTCSWDYSSQACAEPSRGCVDFGHAALWGMLGLLVEEIK